MKMNGVIPVLFLGPECIQYLAAGIISWLVNDSHRVNVGHSQNGFRK
jgi:hypothetical protein